VQRKHNKALVSFAKELRKNMTREEKHLWYDFLRNHPFRFQRQKILGKYIVDSYCAEAKLAIELDGSQHFEPNAFVLDEIRTAFLLQYDILVIRIPNIDIRHNFEGVCSYIDEVLHQRKNKG